MKCREVGRTTTRTGPRWFGQNGRRLGLVPWNGAERMPSQWGYGLLDLASNAVRLCLNDGIQNVGNAAQQRETCSRRAGLSSSSTTARVLPGLFFYCFNNPTNMRVELYSGEILLWDARQHGPSAHHRSRTAENYWAQTRASISRSGKYVAFDSNYNKSRHFRGVIIPTCSNRSPVLAWDSSLVWARAEPTKCVISLASLHDVLSGTSVHRIQILRLHFPAGIRVSSVPQA